MPDRSRFVPYLGIVAALAVGVFVVALTSGTTESHTPITITVPPVATSSSTHTSATTTLVQSTLKKSAPTASTQKTEAKQTSESAVPVTDTTPAQTEVTQAALDASAAALRAALVNILCTVPAENGASAHSISGSGVIIDSKGIILTNAHVAAYFLLENRGASCVIRTGSPATPHYDATPIYIPTAWLSTNVSVLTQTEPVGTGEDDFALLAITKSATSASLPATFPAVPLAIAPPTTGTPVVIATYGAQFLTTNQLVSELSPTVVFGSVKERYTFATNTADIFSLGGSAAAQEGSSGGGVTDASGNLVGTITTSTVSGATDTRSLYAITASYIRATYASATGKPLDLLLSAPIANSINTFTTQQFPTLEAIITAHLQ